MPTHPQLVLIHCFSRRIVLFIAVPIPSTLGAISAMAITKIL
jgi:hypothetical protein